MATEIFRFMTIRPPQEVDSATAAKNIVDLNNSTSNFIEALVRQRKSDSREGIEKLVQGFLRSNDAGFINSRKKVDPRFLSFYESLIGLEEKEFHKTAKDSFIKIFDVEPKKFVQENDFKELFVHVTDSIVIAAIDQDVESKVRSLLVSLAKTLGLIQKLAVLQEKQVYSKADFHSQIIVLPEGIFPLPTIKQDLSKLLKAEKERLERNAKNQAKLLKLSKDLTANRNAISDLLATFEKSIVQTKQPKPASKKRSALANRDGVRGGFTLSDKDVNSLSHETKVVLKKIGLELSNIDVAMATSLIERQSSEISNKLYTNGSSMKYMINIGNNLIPSDILLGAMPTDIGDPETELGDPGICPPVPSVNATDEVTVPPEDRYGEAKVLGVADLMIVEQELRRYELGEIAHIENVLKSEISDRTFRTMTTTERSTLTETEVTDEKTKDLTSTERFELQIESEKVVNENTSIEAGLTINASYGPSVDATSNFNYTNSSAKQESNRASATFARETTTRATSKIQKRTLERQFVKTVNEIEEINKHGFDNKDGTENISGVYRFVDKIYYAQIINYGKRLMLEFVVPEPAAFLRYAMTKQPSEGVTQIKPEPPGYCKDNNFVALQPQHIDRENYLYWASRYLAEDIEPPPSEMLVISGQKTKNEISKAGETKVKLDAESFEIPIADGYLPHCAYINNYAVGQAVEDKLVVQIQDQQFDQPVNTPTEDGFVPLSPTPTSKIWITISSYGLHTYEVLVTVFCTLSLEKFQQWQIKTYNSIMNAYNDQKSRYDNAVETARIRAGDYQISGTNPLMNRECEKTELKKGCISLLTAQNFETFDAMKRNVAPHGYPEIAFADAQAEGRYIQFFENAFEWRNMTYIFYPYFWGKKDDWPIISQISDNDPLYTRFLQAGAARVQVPVRPGFEVSLCHYLSGCGIWYGEGTLVNSEDGQVDPLYLAVLDELKEQLGNQNIDGKGRLTVKKGETKVKGIETEFTQDDENKRIIIKGKTYLINEVASSTEIRLTEKFIDADESDVRYSMGPKLVGEPWEVKLPTNLVMIDEHKTLADINETIKNG